MRMMVAMVMLVGVLTGVAAWIEDTGQESRAVEAAWMAEDQLPVPTPRPPMR